MKRFFATLTLTVMLCAASADDINDTVEQTGDSSIAVWLLKPFAGLGVAWAQFFLAMAYNGGDGVRQDFAEAERLVSEFAAGTE